MVPPASVAGRLLGPAPLGSRVGALVVLLPGIVMLIWGAISLGPNLTPATQPLAEGEMVERGAYRVVRHPVYLGLSLSLWGLAWSLTTPWTGVVVAVASFGYFDRKAAVEERWMLARFPAYEAYRKRVGKLLPRIV
ncbi:MAG TPA: isoprenylcysteine carboxylmethyltransferase family protein [Gemmatimonadales bacterium]|nr:isoprenylcysteine carboxylmethyltransferase family protein [Gemmatimonadales bacterium]